MQLKSYLRRIGLPAATLAADLATLRSVTRHHAMSIPFENIAVLVSGPPDLALPAVEAKLVEAGRGGYCYEQNSLLAAALGELGFRVTGLSARVRYGMPADLVTPRSHMVLLVETESGPACADAGFGGLTLTAPVALQWHEPQATPHERVRLVPVEGDHLLQAEIGSGWADVYRFDLSCHLPADYVQQNWHTATRPNALFANNLVVTLPTPEGRYALFNRTLTWRPLRGDSRRRAVESRQDLREVLQTTFGLAPSPEELDAAWEVSGRNAALNPAFS